MAEPQILGGNPQDEPASSSGSNARSPQEGMLEASALFLASAIQPTDSNPTVISRSATSTRSDDMSSAAVRGQRLGHFELLEPIGVGGMAAVIRSRDTQLERTVALKILPREMAADPEVVRRFHHEARAAAKLDHENIARVFFCGEDQGLYFIAFEYIEGENLRTILERQGRLPVSQVIQYTMQIAAGLAHAAARGVVHRDIKPSNIIISTDGRAKLVDMGLARSREAHVEGHLTQSGVTLGTFDYISPEQALEPREADVRSDVYSLGCTVYHMLTGQPPVPDGTAAKKLHHHQHVDPLDPRQLNPDIPDNVALLLSRMMAKNPAERYQQPEELLCDLVVVARKLGVIAEIPKEAYFGEGPKPTPGRRRPILFASLAVACLAGFLTFLGPGSGQVVPSGSVPRSFAPQTGEAASIQADDEKQAVDVAAVDKQQPDAEAPVDEPVRYEASDAHGLAAYLRSHPVAHVVLKNDLTLPMQDQLTFDGQELTIESANPDHPSTITLEYGLQTVDRAWAALTIRSDKARIQGVRFIVDSHQADIVMTALALERGNLVVEQCEFLQKVASSSETGRISSVTINASSDVESKPTLTLQRCYFSSGQRSVTLLGGGSVRLAQCAFAPQTVAAFDLQPAARANADSIAGVTIRSASFMLSSGSVFRLQDDVACRLNVDNSIISRPPGEPIGRAVGALIEQTGGAEADFEYAGAHNAYHHLLAFWTNSSSMATAEKIVDLDSFKKCRFAPKDEQSVELTNSPWVVGEPLAMLVDQPSKAFQINPEMAELRRGDERRRAIGMESWLAARPDDLLLPDLERASVARNRELEKIVDPSVAASRDNVYRTLRQALEDARPGDTIFIRHTGILAVDPVRLEKSSADLTIRPVLGYHPVLTIGSTPESDAALFRLHDGQLHLEQLEFRLQPDRADFRSQAIVAIMGDGSCSFRDCVATLEDARETALSFVTLADSSGVMKMQPPAQPLTPRLEVTNCFVRGTGNLLAVRASRPFELKLERSLVALDGSLLVVDGNPKELPLHARSEVALNSVTTFLTESLISLRAFKDETKNSKGLLLTQVHPVTDCLFVSAPPRAKSLVHLEGIDNEEQVRRCFSWSEARHNAYGNFTSYLDQVPWAEKDMMPPPAFYKTQWEQFTGETDSRYDRVWLNVARAPDLPFSKIPASSFRPRAEANLQGFGVDIDHLPKTQESTSTTGN
jgi:predicted Ser/Thr protein kinase